MPIMGVLGRSMNSCPGGGHVPVLLDEVLALLDPQPGERVLDATVGCAGHAVRLAERIGPEGTLVGIDRDDVALARAAESLKSAAPCVCLRHANFTELEGELDECGMPEVDVALFDLGMSSLQVDDPERGFSFRKDGPLDMRFDRTEPITAARLVNESSEEELAEIFSRLGEERSARRIAREIVRRRERERIRRTTELADLVERAKRGRRGRIHPATRVFQALRMAVNREVECLEKALVAAFGRLASGGRMGVIAFHSIDERKVKNLFRLWKREGRATLVTKRPVRPGGEEIARNPRSRSARLRVLRREA